MGNICSNTFAANGFVRVEKWCGDRIEFEMYDPCTILESADFPKQSNAELLERLFHHEHPREIRAVLTWCACERSVQVPVILTSGKTTGRCGRNIVFDGKLADTASASECKFSIPKCFRKGRANCINLSIAQPLADES